MDDIRDAIVSENNEKTKTIVIVFIWQAVFPRLYAQIYTQGEVYYIVPPRCSISRPQVGRCLEIICVLFLEMPVAGVQENSN